MVSLSTPGAPRIGFYLSPCLPEHVAAPHFVVQTVELQIFRFGLAWLCDIGFKLQRWRTCSVSFLAIGQSKLPQLHGTSVTEAGSPFPRISSLCCPNPPAVTMSFPRNSHPTRTGFLVALYRPVASGPLASHETSRPRSITLSPTCHLQHPGVNRWFNCPLIPTSVASLPAQTIRSAHTMTYDEADSSSWLLRPAGLHLRSRSLEPWASRLQLDLLLDPRTGRLGSGDLHPIRLMSVPACQSANRAYWTAVYCSVVAGRLPCPFQHPVHLIEVEVTEHR